MKELYVVVATGNFGSGTQYRVSFSGRTYDIKALAEADAKFKNDQNDGLKYAVARVLL